MKRTVVLLVVAALASGCKKRGRPAPPATPEAARCGEMTAVTSSGTDRGTVQIKEESDQWHTCVPGEQLFAGTMLRVGLGTSALLVLEGRRELALGPGTEATLEAPGAVELARGAAFVSTTFAQEPAPLTLSTPAGEIRIEDAVASVSLDGEALRVAVVSGSAVLEHRSGEVPLRAGQEARAVVGRVAVLPVQDPAGLTGWTRGLRAGVSGEKDGGPQVVGPRGLGTLEARTAGGDEPVPFHLLSQKVTVRIQDSVALTEVEQVFRNPSKATVEGTYRFSLPPGARINRYAVEIDGKMMEGEIVTRKKGRAIVKKVGDLFLDPALARWESGSTFRTRLYPVLPGQERKVVVSYVQLLPGVHGSHRYVLPLAADGVSVPQIAINATVSGSRGAPAVRTPLYPASVRVSEERTEVEWTARDFVPMADFVLDIASTRGSGADLVTFAGKGKEPGYFMLSLTPDMTGVMAGYGEAADWVLLVDTSRSRTTLDLEVQKRLVGSIIAALSSRDRVKVLAYDVHPRSFGDGWETPSGKLVDEVGAFVAGRPPAGATNLEAALAAAAEAAGDGEARIVLVGDGAATLGETRTENLASLARSLLGEARVTTIGVGSSVDALLLARLARQSGGKFHHLSPGEDPWASAVQIITAMRTPVLEDAQIAFEGIEVEQVFPRSIANLSPGEDLVITGRYSGQGEVTATLTGRVAGEDLERTHGLEVGEANDLVPLVWASSKIDALALVGGEEAVSEIETLSMDYALATRVTSFVVLESEKTYEDFAIEHEDAPGAIIGSSGSGVPHGRVETATIEKVEVPEDDEKSVQRLKELEMAVLEEPLSRTARRDLVDFFVMRYRYVEAYEAAKGWHEMDGTNRDVLVLMGRLAWIRGRPAEAVRIVSGILDVSPEDRSTMRMLASYHEMREQWEEAHAYRFSLYLLTPKDSGAAVDAVFSFVRIGKREEAMAIAKERFCKVVAGKLRIRGDVHLPAHEMRLLEAIVKGEDPPELEEMPGKYTVEDSRLVATLSWEGDVDLDLWVTDSADNLLGLGAHTGKVRFASSGGEKEVYYLDVPAQGTYGFRAICADADGCPSASGTLEIKALDGEEKVSFEMKDGWAVDLARVRIGAKSTVSPK